MTTGWVDAGVAVQTDGMDGGLVSVRGCLHVGGWAVDLTKMGENEQFHIGIMQRMEGGRRSVALVSVVLKKYIMSYLKNLDLFKCNLD